jgi:protein-tyrosine-phosphatase
MMASPRYNVVFLCTHNSARSIMAECLLNHLGRATFRAYSAGSHPSGQINPDVLHLLRRNGFDTSHLASKSWNDFASPSDIELDFVFTLCDKAAGETCPVWPGQPMTAHWPFPDPDDFQGTEAERRAFIADLMGQIRKRIGIFASLPIASLDRLSLQRKLDEIGETRTREPGSSIGRTK